VTHITSTHHHQNRNGNSRITKFSIAYPANSKVFMGKVFQRIAEFLHRKVHFGGHAIRTHSRENENTITVSRGIPYTSRKTTFVYHAFALLRFRAITNRSTIEHSAAKPLATKNIFAKSKFSNISVVIS